MGLRSRRTYIDIWLVTTDMIEPSKLIGTSMEKELQKKAPFRIDHIWEKLVDELNIPKAYLEYFTASLSLVLAGGYLEVTNLV
jgi:hypothetical protein